MAVSQPFTSGQLKTMLTTQNDNEDLNLNANSNFFGRNRVLNPFRRSKRSGNYSFMDSSADKSALMNTTNSTIAEVETNFALRSMDISRIDAL